MLREIRKKMVILRNRSPFRQEVKDYLNDLEYREWIHMNMRLSGSGLTPAQIDEIMRGGCVMEATVSDHLMLDRLEELRQFIYRLTDMGARLSQQIIQDMHAIISGQNRREDYRKSSPVLQEYGCMAMMASDIPEAMAQLVYFAGQHGTGMESSVCENPMEKAALLHNRLLEIYPFHEGNEMTARAVMYYILAEAGLPLAALQLGRQEYQILFSHYLKYRDSRGLGQLLGQAVMERLDLMMQLTRYEY